METYDFLDSVSGNDIVSDIYDMVSEIEFQIQNGDTDDVREDTFKEYINKIFGMLYKSGEVETETLKEIISNIDNSHDRELMEFAYNEIVNRISAIYDRYIGVKFNYDEVIENTSIDNLYSVYKVLYLNEWDVLGKIFAYLIVKNPDVYNWKSNIVFEDILKDTERFNFDTIPRILGEIDPGNVDNEYVFGEATSLEDSYMTDDKVSIEFDAWTHHILRELAAGAGVLNMEKLRECMEKHIDLLIKNKE